MFRSEGFFSKPEMKKSNNEEKEKKTEKINEGELVEKIDDLYQQLKELKGEEAAKQIFSDIADNSDSFLAEKRFDNMVDRQVVLEKAWERMGEMGFFETSPEGEKIFDLEKLKEGLDRKILEKLGTIFRGKYFGNRNVLETLYLLFKDAKGISKEDYEKGIREEKDLMYFPETEEDALDVEKIKQSNFHLSLYDLIKKVNYKNAKYGNLDGLDYREVVLPMLIYHPKYGNGYRDKKDGKIYILDKKTNQMRQLTSEYIQKNWGVFGSHGRGDNFAQPQLFVKKHLPHLIKNDLLIPEDFTTRRDKRNRNSAERAILKIKSKGQIWFNGMEYNTGTENAKFGNKAYQLSKKLGGIVNKNGELNKIFDLFEKNEKFSRTPNGSKLKYYQVRKTETNIRDFRKEYFFEQKSNESTEDYQKRISEIPEFGDVLEISDKLLVEENINLVELDFKNQLLVAKLYKRIGEKKFMEFAHEYKMDGLKACLALESGNEMEKVILQIGSQKEKDSQFSARLIFRKYNQIIREKENLENVIKQMIPDKKFKKEDYQDIENNFEKRARKILDNYSVNMSRLSVDEVEKRLSRIQKEMEFLGAILKLFKERKKEFFLEDIKGLEISEISAKELTEDKKLASKLREMYRANNSHKSKEDLERLMSDFEKHLEHDAKFHLVYFDKDGKKDKKPENLVGFMRSSNFDGQKVLPKSERYLGAMNIDPLLQKFYFGENFLRQTLEKEFALGAQKIVAHVPENGASHKIIKNLEFNCQETPEGEYKNNDGSVLAKRIRVELVKE